MTTKAMKRAKATMDQYSNLIPLHCCPKTILSLQRGSLWNLEMFLCWHEYIRIVVYMDTVSQKHNKNPQHGRIFFVINLLLKHPRAFILKWNFLNVNWAFIFKYFLHLAELRIPREMICWSLLNQSKSAVKRFHDCVTSGSSVAVPILFLSQSVLGILFPSEGLVQH